MTKGEELYELERQINVADCGGDCLLPRWCDLDGRTREAWIQRGLAEERVSKSADDYEDEARS